MSLSRRSLTMRSGRIGSIGPKNRGLGKPPLWIVWEEQTSSGTRLEHLALAASKSIRAYLFFLLALAFFGPYGFTALKFLSFLDSMMIGTQKNAAAGTGLNATAPTMTVAAATMIVFFHWGAPPRRLMFANFCVGRTIGEGWWWRDNAIRCRAAADRAADRRKAAFVHARFSVATARRSYAPLITRSSRWTISARPSTPRIRTMSLDDFRTIFAASSAS
jgi:hypothetical protein